MSMKLRTVFAMGAFSIGVACLADEIPVAPGNGTIAAAALGAKDGDVLMLQAGVYDGAVTLPAGVTLRGAGAGETVLMPVPGMVVRCDGPRVVVQDLTIRGDDTTIRGINTDSAVRVERVRFEGVREAVALMAAPLSDVVACEFIDCEIGVRAIAEASPTVYGCVFSGGNIGVFAMGGAPFVRNNLFVGCNEGLRLAPSGTNQPIVRNNLFSACGSAGITVMRSREALGSPFIRNTVFVDCASAIVMEAPEFAGTVQRAVVHRCGSPIVRNQANQQSVDPEQASLVVGDPGLGISPDFAIAFANPDLLKGKGVRLAVEPMGSTCDIGPTVLQFGTRLADTAAAPIRWNEPELISNCVSEQYIAMRMLQFRPVSQALIDRPGGRVDVHANHNGDTMTFNISRYFAEYDVK
jgi:hypothetical protein